MAKKKVSKKKKALKKKSVKALKKVKSAKPNKKLVQTPESLFDKWWCKTAIKKVEKIEKKWIKENEPNDPNDDDGGGDHWHVNQMMHEGDASEMAYDIAKEVFIKGYNKESWDFTQDQSLYCELDDVIAEAYPAGKLARKA